MDMHPLISLAKTAARSAGDHARRSIGQMQPELKSGDQIVTQADRQCQQMIIDLITDHYPDHGFIGEEGPGGDMLKIPPKNGHDIWWIIDPIDGTRNFAHHVPLFAVSLAAMKNGLPIVGVIYDPNTNMLFAAAEGCAATCNEKTIQRCNDPFNPNSQFAVTGNYSLSVPPGILHLLTTYVCVNLGSAALHYAYTAMGSFAACYSDKVKLWDIAAGAIINQSLGAVMCRPDGRPIFPFNCDGYQGRPIPSIVTGQHQLPQFIKILQSA